MDSSRFTPKNAAEGLLFFPQKNTDILIEQTKTKAQNPLE